MRRRAVLALLEEGGLAWPGIAGLWISTEARENVKESREASKASISSTTRSAAAY